MYGTNNNNEDEESPMVEGEESESTKSSTSLSNHQVSPARQKLQRIGLILFVLVIPLVAYFSLPIRKSPYSIITNDKLPDNTRIYLSSAAEGVYLRSTASGELQAVDGQPWIHGSTFEIHRVTDECFRLQSVKNNLWLRLNANTGVIAADSEQEEKGSSFAAIATDDRDSTVLKLCYDDQWLEISPVTSSEQGRTLRVSAPSSAPSSSSSLASSISSLLFQSPATAAATIPSNTISLSVIPELRGVNLGGWFIPEVWMNSVFYRGSGLGWSGSLCRMVNNYSHVETESRMLSHLETWFTAADFDGIKAKGFNSVRVPLGYWNIIQDTHHRYAPSDVNVSHAYLTWALEQCRRVNLTVLIDLHGLPGSQNAIDHSGCNDPPFPLWHEPHNQQLSLDTIEELMARFAIPFADIVIGVELANEPSRLYSDTRHDLLVSFYQQAYAIIRGYSSSMMVVINELYEESYPLYSNDLQEPEYYNVIMDYHLYDWQQPYTGESREQHIKDAQGFAGLIQLYRKQHPIIVGEWSMSTGIILEVGQAFVDGCVTSFENNAHGWYLWNWKINANSSTQFAAWDVQLMSSEHSLDPFLVVDHPAASSKGSSWWGMIWGWN